MDWIEDDSDDEQSSSSKTPEKSVRLLDYACGTGLVSRVRHPYTAGGHVLMRMRRR